MRIGNLREGGTHEIETVCELAEVERFGNFSRFETASCVVVYGDRGNPSHSVRIFKSRES